MARRNDGPLAMSDDALNAAAVRLINDITVSASRTSSFEPGDQYNTGLLQLVTAEMTRRQFARDRLVPLAQPEATDD